VPPPSGAQTAKAHTLAKHARATPPSNLCGSACPIVDARAYDRDARAKSRDARSYGRDERTYGPDARSYGRNLPRHSATNVISLCAPRTSPSQRHRAPRRRRLRTEHYVQRSPTPEDRANSAIELREHCGIF
jgi:hypothetical protein